MASKHEKKRPTKAPGRPGKPYESPRLREYGTLTRLVQKGGGGKAGMNLDVAGGSKSGAT